MHKGFVLAKNSLLSSVLVAVFCSVALIGGVSAEHTSTVTISPAWVDPGVLYTFTVAVTHDTGPDDIREVRIYNNTIGHTDFACGSPPTGWTLIDQSATYNYCQYQTNTDYIETGETEYFTFDAKMTELECTALQCIHKFRTSTLDTKEPIGDIVYNYPEVYVDCFDPNTNKTYGTPSFPANINTGGAYPHYITTSTPIKLNATDDAVVCDSGVDKTWYIDFVVPDGFCMDENDCAEICPDPYDTDGACIDHCQEETCSGLTGQSWADCVEKCVYENCGVYCGYNNNKYAWELYTGPFTKKEESCHLLQFFSVDNVGNVESMHHQCVFVDDTPPESIKEVGDPKLPLCDIPQRPPEFYTEEFGLIGDRDNPTPPDFALDDPRCPNDPDATVTKTLACDKVVWDIELAEITEEGESYDHTEFGLVIGFSEDQAEFQVGTTNKMGDEPPMYQPCDGTPEGLFGCWDGTPATQTLPEGIVIINPETSNPSVNGDSKFHIEIPIEYLNNGDFYWSVVVFANWYSDTSGWHYYGYSQYPADWNRWKGKGIYDYDGWKDWWVRDHVTPITLSCEDQEPHPVDNEEVCFKVSFDEGWLTQEYCNNVSGTMEGDWCCKDKEVTIIFQEDSLHDLHYYCRDALGNKNDVDTEYFKVDSQPPIIEKTMTGPQIGECPPEPGTADECWIKDWSCEQGEGTTIHIDAWDDDTYGCMVDEVTCDWWYYLDGGVDPFIGGTGLTPPFDIKFYDETQHELHVKCCDLLGNCDQEDVETFYVDSSGPEVQKEFFGPKKIDPIVGTQYAVEWIDGVTEIELTATDKPDAPCAVGEDKIYYAVTPVEDKYCWQPGEFCYPLQYEGDPFQEYTGRIGGILESCHLLEYYAVDKLGNVGPRYTNCFFVDHTAPDAIKEHPDAIADSDGELGDFHWVTSDTDITFKCDDSWGQTAPHPAFGEELCFKVSYDEDPDDYNTDVYCNKYSNDGAYMEGDWCCISATMGDPFVFNFNAEEDSVHDLEYFCRDAVNKTSPIKKQWYRVDTTPPTTEKTYEPDAYVDENNWEYIDTKHDIVLTAEDKGDVCHVGGIKTWYYYTVVGDTACKGETACDPVDASWTLYEGPFKIPDESCHLIQFYSEDALGNKETPKAQCVFVDKKPPMIEKTYIGPQYPVAVAHPKWINKYTDIKLNVYDQTPHPSGVKEVWYRYKRVDDAYCEDVAEDPTPCSAASAEPEEWNKVSSGFDNIVFNIEEESCHVIEVYAEDNVGKFSKHKQCVFVDNQAPDPLKTVGEPKTKWEPTADEVFFYPEIVDKCWSEDPEESIDCWKVTMNTPITLDCNDPDPHPVDNEEVCFYVELDGIDATEDYCCNYCGTYDKYGDGYCCLEGPIDFSFHEETEHNLDFYCIDALGNSNDVHDDEKFKVEGTVFEIPLYKKWNLISVPFVLLSSAPEEVFKDTTGVDSVWAYDSVNDEWLVYTPGSAPDTLNSIEPGWGYWLMEKNEDDGVCEPAEWLRIGGGLFSPVTVPPSRQLVKGWNLIGYYGTRWQLYPWGDQNFKCGDAFDWEDRMIYGDKAYCALNSLVDTQQGFPKWSSIWGYLNCGHHTTFWLPTGTCPEGDPEIQELLSRMYAGRGYWLELDKDDLYAPATTCIWNTDWNCIKPFDGGGPRF